MWKFASNESVLFLGEGNFSFCKSVIELHLQDLKEEEQKTRFTCTCFEHEPVSDLAKIHTDELSEFENVDVKFGVDATELETSLSGNVQFDQVFFMFPHVGGKMKIHRNRDLLKQFALSVGNVLDPNGQVYTIHIISMKPDNLLVHKAARPEIIIIFPYIHTFY